jgi:hypothetical protein
MTSNQDNSSNPVGRVTFAGTATPDGTPAKKSFTYNMSDGPFTSPTPFAGHPLEVQAMAFAGFGPGGTNSVGVGNSIGVLGVVADSKGAVVGQTANSGPLVGGSKNTFIETAPKLVSSGSLPSYNLRNIGGGLHLGGANASHFFTQAVTFTPEPSGIVLSLLGVPCVFGFVFLRMRRRAAAVHAA